MKKLLLATSVSLVMGISSSVAHAENMYVFGNLGQADFDIGSAPGLSIDETDTTASVGFGYRFSDNFSAELGYVDLGESTISTNAPVTFDGVTLDGTMAIDAKGFFFGVRGDMEVAESFDLFARAGFISWESDVSANGSFTYDGTTYTGSVSAELDDGTDPYLGIGAAYSFNENFSANLQYTRYMLESLGADLDIDTITAGITYKF